jgi:hypothetical protein
MGACSSFNPRDYVAAGDRLSKLPEWKVIISQDLPGWLSHLSLLLDTEKAESKTMQAVLSRIWDADPGVDAGLGDETPLAMAFIALTKVWGEFEFLTIQRFPYLFELIKCTVSTAFRARHSGHDDLTVLTPSSALKDIMRRLGDAVARAPEIVKAATDATLVDLDPSMIRMVDEAVNILSRIASTIEGELINRSACEEDQWGEETPYWRDLHKQFDDDVEALGRLLERKESKTPVLGGNDTPGIRWLT